MFLIDNSRNQSPRCLCRNWPIIGLIAQTSVASI